MNTRFLGDTALLTGRSLRHITRSPDTIITTTITPIALMLLFVYVFGGAISSGSGSYVNYMLPGILLITIASSIAYTAFRLFMDKSSGIVERFQSMPIARSGVLWAHVLTSLVANLVSIVVVVLVAVAMGFRSGAGVAAWLFRGPLLVAWQITRDCDLCCLHCCTEGYHFVRVYSKVWSFTKNFLHFIQYLWHSCLTSHHYDFIHIFHFKSGCCHRSLGDFNRTSYIFIGDRFKLSPSHLE